MKVKNSRERMEALVNHEVIDQVPVSFWKHFPVDDQNPSKLAAATIHFQETYQMDFVKVSPSSSFCIKDWGAQDVWRASPEGTRDYLEPVVNSPQDWLKLTLLNPGKGFLGQQLECLKVIRDELGEKVPIIQTVFSPLSQAKNLVGKMNLLSNLRQNSDLLKSGLEIITQTTSSFIEACQKIGLDGIFYAVQQASFDQLSESEFMEFGRYFDEQLFPQFREFWLNVLHLHGKNLMVDCVKDYPFQIFNWHDRETFPNLKNGKKLFGKIVCGGLGRIDPMAMGDEISIKAQIDDALEQTGGKEFILGTGCVMLQTTPYGNIQSAIQHIHSLTIA